jgi:hypothetical protein
VKPDFFDFFRRRIKFNENLSKGSLVVPCRWMDGQTDMTKSLVAFCSFANETKNHMKQKVPSVCQKW